MLHGWYGGNASSRPFTALGPLSGIIYPAKRASLLAQSRESTLDSLLESVRQRSEQLHGVGCGDGSTVQLYLPSPGQPVSFVPE